jgi:imidazolonepropionase-like amidohydrolase
MSVVGHVPSRVGLHAVLADGQRSIEHVYGYFNAIRETPGATVATLAQRTRDAGTWNCPTLTLPHMWAPAPSPSHRATLPGVRFLSPTLLGEWRSRNVFIGSETARFMSTQVRALRDAGAPLLLGTDTPNPWIVPGFAIHAELQQFANAGLTPFEALSTGTRDAARFLGLEHEFGTVGPGKRADLLLLDANPLIDVANVARRAGVMARGRWYAEHELRARLGALERSLASP